MISDSTSTTISLTDKQTPQPNDSAARMRRNKRISDKNGGLRRDTFRASGMFLFSLFFFATNDYLLVLVHYK